MNYQEKQKAISRLLLDNGITLIVVENPTTEIIAGRIFLKNSGGRWEKPYQAGIFNLLARVITKGTERLSSVEIAEKVESLGASLGTDASNDYFLLSLKTVASDFLPILSLAAEIMRHPVFPLQEVELEKHLTLQNILSQKEQPFNVAFNQLREMMYGDHPYGVSILGTEASLSPLTASDLREYHRIYFRPDNLAIALAGKITSESAISMLGELFGDWQNPPTPMPELNLAPPQIESRQQKIVQDTQQSAIVLGYLAPEVKHQDYVGLKLLSSYLGNGLSSRLFVELREKRGLAYDVSAFYPTRLDKSQFVVYMGTAPENVEIGIEGLANEVKRLCEQELSPEELAATKNKLLGQYALGKQTNSELAQLFGWYETLGLGIEFDLLFPELVAEVTSAGAREIAQKYCQTYCLSVVGPE